jgi:ankyrin repeat protein
MFLFLPLETTIFERQQKSALNIMHYLFEKNIDINATNHAGQTALIIVCQSMRERWAMKELIKAPNIDLNHKDMFGKTALIYLAEKRVPSPIKRSLQLLIEAGADPELGDNSGLTPLVILQNRPDQNPGIQEAINYLRDAIVQKYAPKK